MQKKFPQKSQVFLNLEVKRFHKKQKQLLWRLILVWGKAMTQKREKQKWKRRRRYDSPPTIIFTSTKILNGEEFTAASRKAYCERWKIKMQIFVPKSFHSISVGCRNPVQWLLCFIAMFWLFEFAKISIQNVRQAMANFASMIRSSKQNKMFVLYKQFTAFSRSNRRPRIFNQMYRATFSSSFLVGD